MKAGAAYLRVSGKGQIKGHGLPRQLEAIRRRAKLEGIRIVAEFRDEGISGTKELADRKGLAALLDRVDSNGIGVVLIERADRLARDLMVGEVILEEFRKRGVRVLTADGTDLSSQDDPTRKLVRQVLGAISEFDKSVTVLKLRAARERIRRKVGVCEGRKAFGYYEGEPEIVDLIYRWRRKPRGKGKQRMSYARIAERLNAEGVPTRTGAPWHLMTVRNVLKRKKPQPAK